MRYRHYFDGEQHLARGDFAAAQASFERSVEMDPEFAIGWQRLGYVLGWRGFAGANDAVKKALARRDSIRTRRERSFLAIQEANLDGDRQRQNSLLEAHLEEFADDKEALFQLGDMQHHNGEFAAGLAHFDRVLTLDPGFERAVDHRMWALLALGRIDEAQATADEFIRRRPSVASFRAAGEVLLAAGRVDASEAAFRRARETFPENQDLLLDLASPDLSRGDLAAARTKLEALLADPAFRDNVSLRTGGLGRLAYVEVLERRIDAADAHLRKIASSPGGTGSAGGDARVFAEHAFLLAWNGREAAARPHVARVLASGQLEDRYVLLSLVLACGKLRDAECLAKLPPMHNHRALAEGFERVIAGDHAGAAEAFARAESFADLRAKAAYATLEAEALLAAGKPEAAVAAARVAQQRRFVNAVDVVFHPLAKGVEKRALEAVALTKAQ